MLASAGRFPVSAFKADRLPSMAILLVGALIMQAFARMVLARLVLKEVLVTIALQFRLCVVASVLNA